MAQVRTHKLEESEFTGTTYSVYAEIGFYNADEQTMSDTLPAEMETRQFDDLEEALAYAKAGNWAEWEQECAYYYREAAIVWLDQNIWEYGDLRECHTFIACVWHNEAREDFEVEGI